MLVPLKYFSRETSQWRAIELVRIITTYLYTTTYLQYYYTFTPIGSPIGICLSLRKSTGIYIIRRDSYKI